MIINTSIGGKSSLEDGSVTTNKIDNEAVTLDKLAADARPIWDNLVKNGCFVGGGSQRGGGQFPINQMGATEYNTTGSTIDCWRIISGMSVALDADCLVLSCDDSNLYPNFFQSFEQGELENGRTYTISILYKTTFASFKFSFQSNPGYNIKSATLPASPDWSVASITFKASNLEIPIISLNGGGVNAIRSISVKGIGLNPGSRQTAFIQDADGNWVINEIPNYAAELAMCQRYLAPLRINGWMRIRASASTSSCFVFIVPVPVTMRTKPTIKNSNLLLVFDIHGVEEDTGYAFQVDGYGPGYVTVLATKQGKTLNDAQLVISSSEDSPFFDAQL